MNRIYSYLLEPGKTYDCQVCVGCDKDFQDNLKAALISNAKDVKFPTVIASFNEKDEQIIYNFLKRNQISGGLFFAVYNLYVDMKLSSQLLKILKLTNDEKFKIILTSKEMFEKGSFNDFKNLYLSTVYPDGILSSIGGKNHCFEVNIFEENLTDIFLQKSINNFINFHNPFAVKIFTDSDDLISHQNSSDKTIETPHDYILIRLNSDLNINHAT